MKAGRGRIIRKRESCSLRRDAGACGCRGGVGVGVGGGCSHAAPRGRKGQEGLDWLTDGFQFWIEILFVVNLRR